MRGRVSFPVRWEFRSVPVAPPAGCSLLPRKSEVARLSACEMEMMHWKSEAKNFLTWTSGTNVAVRVANLSVCMSSASSIEATIGGIRVLVLRVRVRFWACACRVLLLLLFSFSLAFMLAFLNLRRGSKAQCGGA